MVTSSLNKVIFVHLHPWRSDICIHLHVHWCLCIKISAKQRLSTQTYCMHSILRQLHVPCCLGYALSVNGHAPRYCNFVLLYIKTVVYKSSLILSQSRPSLLRRDFDLNALVARPRAHVSLSQEGRVSVRVEVSITCDDTGPRSESTSITSLHWIWWRLYWGSRGKFHQSNGITHVI